MNNEKISLGEFLFYDKTDFKNIWPSIKKNIVFNSIHIDINDKCNMSCKQCFYGFQKIIRKELSIKEYEKILKILINKGFTHFHISGREPLSTPDKLIEILSFLFNHQENHKITYGFITNGYTINNYLDRIKGLGLEYIIFSLELGADKSEQIGHYNYWKVLEDIQITLEKNKNCEIAKEIKTATVLSKDNIEYFEKFLVTILDMDIRGIYIQPFLCVGNGWKFRSKCLLPSEYDRCIKSCIKLLEKNGDIHNKSITFNIYPTYREPLFRRNFWLRELFDNFVKHDLSPRKTVNDNKIDFEFHLCPLCIGYWQQYQLTSDGFLLGCDMMMTTKDYNQFSFGNLNDNTDSFLNSILTPNKIKEFIKKSFHKNEHCLKCDFFRFCRGGCRISSFIRNKSWVGPDPMCPFEIKKYRQLGK